ncbi:hypothetical protein L0F63_003540, partial [Massospora cicadina]
MSSTPNNSDAELTDASTLDASPRGRNWYDSADSEVSDAESLAEDRPHHSRRVVSLFNLSKRTREGLILAGLESTRQVASLGAPELQTALEADPEATASTLLELARLASAAVTPISGLDAFRGFRSVKPLTAAASKGISTGCLAIDQLFSFPEPKTRGAKRAYLSDDEQLEFGRAPPVPGPGIPLGAVTELSGVPKIGKSTLWLVESGWALPTILSSIGSLTFASLQLAMLGATSDPSLERYATILSGQLSSGSCGFRWSNFPNRSPTPSGRANLSVDTEGALPCLIPRLRAMSAARGTVERHSLDASYPSSIDNASALDSIYTYGVSRIDELVGVLAYLRDDWLKAHPEVKLVVVDSVARPFMNLMNHPEAASLRKGYIHQLNGRLQSLSTLGLAVVVVNHLDRVPKPQTGSPHNHPLQVELVSSCDDERDTWSHFANHHLMLVYGRQRQRFAVLAKSSCWPSQFTAFGVRELGITDGAGGETLVGEGTPAPSRQTSELKNRVASLSFDPVSPQPPSPSRFELPPLPSWWIPPQPLPLNLRPASGCGRLYPPLSLEPPLPTQ